MVEAKDQCPIFSVGETVRIKESEVGPEEGRLPLALPEGTIGTIEAIDPCGYWYVVNGKGFVDDELERVDTGGN